MRKNISTDLILNRDGSIYHLHLHPGEVANDIILVGDPRRVRRISCLFDKIEIRRQNRNSLPIPDLSGVKELVYYPQV